MSTDRIPQGPDEALLNDGAWTELGYAQRFVHAYGDRVRYVPKWKKWLAWDGKHWEIDHADSFAWRCMKGIALRMTAAAESTIGDNRNQIDAAKSFQTAKRIAGSLKLAESEPELVVKLDQLDAHPTLLNCRNGVLDLETGQLRPHDPSLLLTKLADTDYDPNAEGPEWNKFLERVQPNRKMRRFLARVLGQALEGRVIEHVLPIFTGIGANGKSTCVGVVLVTLGDYAGPAHPKLLTARTEFHPTHVASLYGKRLAVLHESDAGSQLGEGTVKRLTGGDQLEGRRMYEDPWPFVPSHTFVMLTNHRLLIVGVDEGIWRRILEIPWDVVIPEAERDARLPEKLAEEAPAVLRWLVEGYRDWKEQGLNPPDEVVESTHDYRTESDDLGRFIEERCLLGEFYTVQSSQLYEAWKQWCAGESVEAGSNKALTRALRKRNPNLDKKRSGPGEMWHGIGLYDQ